MSVVSPSPLAAVAGRSDQMDARTPTGEPCNARGSCLSSGRGGSERGASWSRSGSGPVHGPPAGDPPDNISGDRQPKARGDGGSSCRDRGPALIEVCDVAFHAPSERADNVPAFGGERVTATDGTSDESFRDPFRVAPFLEIRPPRPRLGDEV